MKVGIRLGKVKKFGIGWCIPPHLIGLKASVVRWFQQRNTGTNNQFLKIFTNYTKKQKSKTCYNCCDWSNNS